MALDAHLLLVDGRDRDPMAKNQVEHLVSHQAEHFESLEELVAFLVQMVMKQQKP